MSIENDFEVVENSRVEVLPKKTTSMTKAAHGIDKLAGAVADNFGRVLDLAEKYQEIRLMKQQSDNYVAEMEAANRKLKQETESYVARLQAETKSTVDKAEVIRRMMQDFQNSGTNKMSGEEFSQIVAKVIDKLWV